MSEIDWNERKKNRYYKGKQLRSEDFILEQAYVESLMRKSNLLTIGKGVLNGLVLSLLDDHQVCLQEGSAIDGDGNIVCVKHEVPIQLDELEGFEKITRGYTHVYMKYREVEMDPSFSALSNQEDHQEHEHVFCGWKLYLDDSLASNPMEERFLLYEDSDVMITQLLPSVFAKSKAFQLQVEIIKKREHLSLSFAYTLHMQDGAQVDVEICGSLRNHTQRIEYFTYIIKRNPTYASTHSYVAIEKQLTLIKKEKTKLVPITYAHKFPISEHIEADVTTAIASKALPHLRDGVYLGTLYIEEKKRTWRILEVLPLPLSMRLLPAYIQMQQHHALSYYESPQQSATKEVLQPVIEESSGSIAMSALKKKGDIYRSEMIPHLLGPHSVHVEVFLHTHIIKQGQKQLYVDCGATQLFEHPKKQGFQYGVRVAMHEGTFEIACKSDIHDMDRATLLWQARRLKQHTEVSSSSKLVRIEPSMVRLSPLSSCVFTPCFEQEEDICECHFSLANEGDGEIRQDGTYIAPATVGIYQIIVTSVQGDIVYAYAHVYEEIP